MRACHEESMLCLRVGDTRPTKDLVGNLNRTEYCRYLPIWLCNILSYYQCEILHTCAQVCALSYSFFKCEKEHVNCSWLSIQNESIQIVLNIVCQCNRLHISCHYPSFGETHDFTQSKHISSKFDDI